jgi:hypothetical protein
MNRASGGLKPKHERALALAFASTGAGKTALATIDRIDARVRKFRASGAEPDRTAVFLLDRQFELSEWSDKVFRTLENMDEKTMSALVQAAVFKFELLPPADALRNASTVVNEAAHTNDYFRDMLLYACDITVEEVWKGKDVHNKAVRRLVRGVLQIGRPRQALSFRMSLTTVRFGVDVRGRCQIRCG